MTYHVARNNQQLGTFSKEEILQRYNSGAILPDDLVWTEGMAAWEAASKVFGPPVPPAAGGDVPPVAPPPVTGVATPFTVPPSVKPPKPDNYLVWSIITTLLCCLPLGIAAIIFSSQVDSKYNAGDYEGAVASAEKAKKFCIFSVVGCVVAIVLYIAFIAVMVALGHAGR